MKNVNILEVFEFVAPFVQPVLIGGFALLIIIWLIRGRSGMKAPVGRGFKHIRLPRVKSRKIKDAIRFWNLVRGMLIVGGAGSGKTKSIIHPLIEETVREEITGIIYDFKFPSLANKVYQESCVSSGIVKYYFVNFEEPRKSHRFNVLGNVRNTTYSIEYANALMQNLIPESTKRPDFFTRSATMLLASAIFYFDRQQKRICTLPHVIEFLLHPNLAEIIEVIDREPLASSLVASVKSGIVSDKQTAGVVSTLQSALALLVSPNIYWVLSGNDFDLNLNNPRTPKLLLLGSKASLSTSLSPVIALIITAASREMNESGKAKSILLLDEGPTLFIPGFDMIPATGREHQIATVFCAQDLAQLEQRYGEQHAEVMIGNLATQVYGKLSSPRTAEKVVKLFGLEEVQFESRSTSYDDRRGDGTSSGVTRAFHQRERVSISHLRDLNPGQFVVSSPTLKDFKIVCKQGRPDDLVLPELSYAPASLVERNYEAIKMDVAKLFKTR
jgi:hypothetical protein